MRDYGKVSPQFWVGKTGKALRGNMPAQILALYLMTSPHANMIGIYYCPIEYMAKETGLSMEGASEALRSLIKADFCTYEADDELIFVHAFAAHQIGESLKPTDLRVKGIISELEKVPKGQCWRGFRARYAVPYNIPVPGQIPEIPASPYEAPTKPEAEAGSEAEAEAEFNKEPIGSLSTSPPPASVDPASEKPAKANSELPDCPYTRLLQLWAKHLPQLSQPRVWEGTRRTVMRQRWVQAAKPSAYSPEGYKTEAAGIAWWDSFFSYIANDTALSSGFESNGRVWVPDLEWVMKPANFQKIIDGKYTK